MRDLSLYPGSRKGFEGFGNYLPSDSVSRNDSDAFGSIHDKRRYQKRPLENTLRSRTRPDGSGTAVWAPRLVVGGPLARRLLSRAAGWFAIIDMKVVNMGPTTSQEKQAAISTEPAERLDHRIASALADVKA